MNQQTNKATTSMTPRTPPKPNTRSASATTAEASPTTATTNELNNLDISHQNQADDTQQPSPNKKKKTNPKKTKGRFFAFQMQDGTMNAIDGVRAANSFEKDYADIIKEKKDWTTKKPRDKCITNHKQIPLPTAGPNTELESRATLIMDGVTKDNIDSSNRIEAYWKTTSNSTKAVVAWRLRTPYTDDFWCWKAEWMLDILIRIADDKECTDPLIKDYLKSLTCGFASDPNNYDKTVKKVVEYEDRQHKKRSYEALVPYGFIDIPVDTLDSPISEDEWLSATTQKIMDYLLTLFRGDLFQTCVKKMPSREKFAAIIFDETKKSNWIKHMASAIVRAKRLECLTHIVIQQEANRITDILYSNRLPNPKCVTANDSDDHDSSDEEEE
jgi:hypothetical protein